jgi:type IV pilus assembly protein PilX
MGSATGSSPIKGELNYAEAMRFASSAGPYFRIIVRVQGARNTVSFTETIVHF